MSETDDQPSGAISKHIFQFTTYLPYRYRLAYLWARLFASYRWRLLPRVRRHRVSSPQGSSSNMCFLSRYHHGPFNVSLFPHPRLVQWTCDEEPIEGGIRGCVLRSFLSDYREGISFEGFCPSWGVLRGPHCSPLPCATLSPLTYGRLILLSVGITAGRGQSYSIGGDEATTKTSKLTAGRASAVRSRSDSPNTSVQTTIHGHRDERSVGSRQMDS